MKNKLPYRKSPCSECPFRKDSGSLAALGNTMLQIIQNDVHTCHKTQGLPENKLLQCAGHMILLDDENTFVALTKRMNIPLALSGQELVFDTVHDALKHHSHKTESCLD